MFNDKLIIGGHEFSSRFILGSGKYSMKLIESAVKDAGAEIITLAVRRANTKEHENILDYIPQGITLLPNTSGARNAEEAVRIARLARELGCGNFVKIEIMRDSKYLLPDNVETVKATEILANEGFVVMPYMYPDLNTARDLVNAGAASVMPLASPIGSNKGLATKEFGSTSFRLFLGISAPFRSETDAFRHSYLHCFRVLRSCKWDKLWSSKTPRMQLSPHPRCLLYYSSLALFKFHVARKSGLTTTSPVERSLYSP